MSSDFSEAPGLLYGLSVHPQSDLKQAQLKEYQILVTSLVAAPKLQIAPPQKRVVQETAPIWPAVLLAWSLIIPEATSIMIGSYQLFYYRIALLLSLPFVVREFIAGRQRLTRIDALIGLAISWVILSLIVMTGIDNVFENGGAVTLDIGGSYFCARAFMQNSHNVRRYLDFIIPAFFIAGLSVVLEAMEGRYIVQPFFAGIFGRTLTTNIFTNIVLRMGLLRGTGPFPHPILAGLILSSLFPIIFLAKPKILSRYTGIITSTFSLATVSSAAYISFFLSIMLVIYEKYTEKSNFLTWRKLVNSVASVAIFIQVFYSGGLLKFIARYLTLDKSTAYFRLLIYDYGADNVSSHPWFGIGQGNWVRPSWMPPSIDNYWLFIAIDYGLPVAIIRFTIAISAIYFASVTMMVAGRDDRRLALGFTIAISLMTLMGFTVAFWGVAQVWYFYMIGTSVSLASFQLSRSEIHTK